MVSILLQRYLQTDISRSSGPAVGGSKKTDSDFVLGPDGFIFLKYLEMSRNSLKYLGISRFASDSLEIRVWRIFPVLQGGVIVLEISLCSGGWEEVSS